MNISIVNYKTIVFDCDGVVMNSNCIKSEAFRISALPWGANAANALVSYHISNGGISRYTKFVHFLEYILPQFASTAVPGVDGPGLDELLASYAQAVHSGLMTCPIAEGLSDLRSQTPNAKWFIVSGGDQNELREIFSLRGLDRFFDGGIYGSPDAKTVILEREIKKNNFLKPAIFLGDSEYDFESAKASGLDFVFIHGWTDVADWKNFVTKESISSVEHVADLLIN